MGNEERDPRLVSAVGVWQVGGGKWGFNAAIVLVVSGRSWVLFGIRWM